MSDIDVNKIQQNVKELQDQNAIDFQQWKKLGKDIEKLSEKIKLSDTNLNMLMKKIKNDYEKMKKIIIDENIQVQLNNKIELNKNEIVDNKNKIDYVKIKAEENSNKIEQNKNEINKKVNIETFENKVDEISSQLDTIASVPLGVNIAKEINTLINNNIKSIKIPKGEHYVSETIKLSSGVQLIGDKGSILYTDKNISIITTKDENVNYDDIFLYGLNISQNYDGITSYPVIALKNANMCRVERTQCYISNTNVESEPALRVYSTLTNISNHGGIYSILIDKCDFRNSSVDINITDSYITNTNIWGVNRKYALHIGKSSQQINNCQFVGGDDKGAVWIEDLDNSYNIEIIKICNCYFDGSYEDVKSGIGLNAKQMRYSNVSNCSFWYQKKDGMVLDGCFGNTFVGLTFEGNGRDNLTQNTLNNRNGYADIKIKNATYDNIFSNIIFVAEGNYYIKNKAIHGINTSTFENHFNTLTNLTIIDYNNYDSNAYDFNFQYVGSNIKASNFLQNKMNGVLNVNGEIQATTGFKTSILFSHDNVVGNINALIKPSGQTKTNYLVCNNGSLLDIGVNVETGITSGSITVQVIRNNEVLAEQIMDKFSPYFKITNFKYGEKRIYKGDLLKVKLITSSDLSNCDYLTSTINISQ